MTSKKIFYRIVLRYRVKVNFPNCISPNLSRAGIDRNVDGIEISILKGAESVLAHSALRSVIIELGTDEEREKAIALMKQAGLEVKQRSTRNWGEAYLIFERI